MMFKEMGELIKKTREKHAKTQKLFALEIGAQHGQFVGNVENGVCSMPPKYFKRLEKFYGVSMSKLKKIHMEQAKRLMNENIEAE